MKLSEEIKLEIKKEFEDFKHKMYDGKTLEERKKLDQFFTPPQVSIPLLENLETVKDIDILDPTSGSGNLLAAALIAGADSDKVFGNEYDATMVKLCRERLNKVCDMLGKPHIQDWQIHQGNALQARCLIEFGEEYDTNYNPEYIDDLEYAQSYEHDEEQTFFGETSVYPVNKLSWTDENRKARERLENKQQLEKRNMQKMTEKTEKAEQVNLFEDFFGGN